MADFDRAYIVTGNTIAERVPKSAGNVGENIVTSLSFTFSDEWLGASKTIVFKSPKKALLTPIALVDDSVPIPVEALDSAGKLQFSLQGTFAGSAKVIRTPIKELDVNGTLPYTGGTPIATYTNVVSECQDATVLAESAASQATQAAALIAGVPAAELVRETNENERISSELLRESEKIKGNDGKKYRIVACVLRNDGGVWNFFEDENHKAINVASVSQTVDDIRLDFTFAASKVGGMTVSPDETYVRDGLSFGASVGTTFATIRPIINKHVGGYIYFNGTSWVISNAPGVISAVWSTDKLVITHGNMYQQSPNIYNAQIAHRGGNYITQLGSLGLNTIDVEFYDFAGNRITTPTANMKIYFDRTAFGSVRTQDLMQSGSNIWVIGIFEVAT